MRLAISSPCVSNEVFNPEAVQLLRMKDRQWVMRRVGPANTEFRNQARSILDGHLDGDQAANDICALIL